MNIENLDWFELDTEYGKINCSKLNDEYILISSGSPIFCITVKSLNDIDKNLKKIYDFWKEYNEKSN